MDLKIYSVQGEMIDTIKLGETWQGHVNEQVVAQAVAMYRNNQRFTIASTKMRGEVSGGGKKPWKQKHTGRARAGSSRSPLWRGGGVVFGPRLRSVQYRLSQTMRRKALVESLKGKMRDEAVVVVDEIHSNEPKTKTFGGLARVFNVAKKSVIVLGNAHEATVKSLRNLPQFTLCRAENLNAYDVVNAQKILITKDAFSQLEERVKESNASSN